jgi:hypothetical protein
MENPDLEKRTNRGKGKTSVIFAHNFFLRVVLVQSPILAFLPAERRLQPM